MVELLAPAGNWPALRAAVEAGTDSVYFGVKQLNMRATADNFDIGELKKIVSFCHTNKIKAYLTLNVIVYDEELPLVRKVLKAAKEAGIDAIIGWDNAVLSECKKLKLETHLSTQASVSNYEALKTYAKLGITRVVLARELSLKQISEIKRQIKKDKLKVQIETFVHGAMCVSISGRCFTSQFVYGRSANRGDCLQPCRREYVIQDAENEFTLKLKNHYVMSAKDLCALPFLDKLIDAGIDCFKIEGRNRTPEYVKTVVSCYREALDAIKKKKFNKELIDKLTKKLQEVYNRDFSKGFFFNTPTSDDFTDAYGSKATMKKEFVGLIRNYYPNVSVAELKVQSTNIKVGQRIMIQGNKTGVFDQMVESLEFNKKKAEQTEKGKSYGLKVNKKVRKNDKVFLISS